MVVVVSPKAETFPGKGAKGNGDRMPRAGCRFQQVSVCVCPVCDEDEAATVISFRVDVYKEGFGLDRLDGAVKGDEGGGCVCVCSRG